MKFIAIVLAILGIVGAPTLGRASYAHALDLMRSGRTSAAYNTLIAIPQTSPRFTDALVEAQKIHYRRQEWSKFFAYAQFYRQRAIQKKVPLRARMVSLEALALAKHCHWGIAEDVLNWGATHQGSTQEVRSELLETRDYLRLHQGYPTAEGKVLTTDFSSVGALFSKTKAWKIQANSLAKISHPRHLSVRLQSRCQ